MLATPIVAAIIAIRAPVAGSAASSGADASVTVQQYTAASAPLLDVVASAHQDNNGNG